MTDTSVTNISGSLRRRLAITLIVGICIFAVLLFFIIRLYAAQIAQQSQDSILSASVTSMLDAAKVRDGQVAMDIPYSSFSMLATPQDDRIFYAIYQDDQLLSGYESLTLPETYNNTGTVFRSIDFMDTPVRQVIASRTLSGLTTPAALIVTVAQTQDNLSVTLRDIAKNAAMIVLGFFLLAVVFSAWASSTTIAPLNRLTQSVTRRGPKDLRPVTRPVPAEMAPLVSSLNHLMQRLDDSLNQSEQFITEAAHRVRTPIATVRSHAEITLQRVDKEENRQALKAMIRATDETSRAAGQLLDHAMISLRASQLNSEPIDLSELIQELVRSLTPVADLKDIEIRLDAAPDVRIHGDSILVQNAVRNLIDNALKYSPTESTINIQVRANPKPSIVINDQGDGFFHDEKDKLTDRFSRGRNSTGTIGSGLGLTIANDVAKAHSGSLRITNNHNGGACVTLSF